MARSWSRGKTGAASALALVAALGAVASAHRKDEYLQASRLGIAPDRLRIELDLTPGIAVADAVVADIDADRNGAIAPEESRGYLTRVLGSLSADVDGRALPLQVIDSAFPDVESMRRGEGTIRVALTAPMPSLAAGAHHLHYRNAHRPEVSAYLANALVPGTDRIAITSQDRDAEQRGLSIAYTIRTGAVHHATRWSMLAFGLALTVLVVSRRQG